MSVFDDPSIADTNTDLLSQQDALDARKALLVARAKQAAAQLGIYAPGGGVDIQQPEGFQSAVTGAKFIAPMTRRPLLADLTPLIAETGDSFAQDRLAQQTSAYNAADRAAAQAAIARFPQGTPAQPATPGGYGPSGGDASSTLITGTPATPAIPAGPATAQDRLNWAAQAGNIPSLKDTVKALITDQLINEPDRVAARQDKKDLQTAQLIQHAEDLAAGRANALLIAQGQQATSRENAAGQQATSRQNAQTMADASGGRNTQVISDGKGGLMVVNKGDATGQPVMIDDPSNPGGPKIPAQGQINPAIQKVLDDQQQQQDNARHGKDLVAEAKALLQAGPTSGAWGTWVDSLGNKLNIPTDSAKRAQRLDVIAKELTTIMPRFGGRATNFDVNLYQQGAGNVNARDVAAGNRLDALVPVEKAFDYALDPSHYSDPRRPSAPVAGSTMLRQPAAPTPTPTQAPPAPTQAPQTEAGLRAASQAAKVAYLKNSTQANKLAMEAAQADLTRFQSQGASQGNSGWKIEKVQ